MTFFVLVLILSEGQAGETWENKKNHCRILGSFRRNSHFHVSRLRHCPGNAKLSCWKETINILTLHTRIHRYVSPPTRPPFRSVRGIAKMRKATVSCIVSIRLSDCPHWTTRSHGADFHEIRYLNIFRKSVEKIQVSLKYGKNYVYFTSRYM